MGDVDLIIPYDANIDRKQLIRIFRPDRRFYITTLSVAWDFKDGHCGLIISIPKRLKDRVVFVDG